MSKQTKNLVLRAANHWKSLILVFALSVLIPTVIFWVIEPYTFIESLEWGVYMITSTGLGSHGATTLAGQIMGITLMIWGPVLLLALVTGAVVNALRVDPNAFTDEEQVEIIEILREIREHNRTFHKTPGIDDEPVWKNPSVI